MAVTTVQEAIPYKGVAGPQAGDTGIVANDIDGFGELDSSNFIELMVTELTNQDPLNPMDNAQMMEQLTQISSLDSNKKLTGALESLEQGQSISTAATMVGKKVRGLDQNNEWVTGLVEGVNIVDGQTLLRVGKSEVRLQNVESVEAGEAADPDIVTASVLGATVLGKQSDGTEFSGQVDRISMVDGEAFVHIGSNKYKMSNIDQVIPEGGFLMPDGTVMDGLSMLGRPAHAKTDGGADVFGMIEGVKMDGTDAIAVIGGYEFKMNELKGVYGHPDDSALEALVSMPDGEILNGTHLVGKTAQGIDSHGEPFNARINAAVKSGSDVHFILDGGKMVAADNIENVTDTPPETDTETDTEA